jgi:hypothetical protein
MNVQPYLTNRHRAPRNVHRRAAGRNFTSLRRVVWGCLLALLITACARQPQSARVEEIPFQSGSFKVVGDLPAVMPPTT